MRYPNLGRNGLYLKPAKRQPIDTRPIVFIHGREKVAWDKLPKKAVIYSTVPLSQIVEEHNNKGVSFEAIRKRRKPNAIAGLSIIGSGHKVRRAPARPEDLSQSEYESAFREVAEYLAANGISYSSPSWAAERIFCQGLTKPIKLQSPTGRGLVRPSRGICYPGDYPNGPFRHFDLRSAYPSVMYSPEMTLPKSAIPLDNPNDWDKQKTGSLTLARVIITNVTPHTSPIILQTPIAEGSPFNPVIIQENREIIDWYFDFELRTIAERHHFIEPIYSFKLKLFDATEPLARFDEILGDRYNPNFMQPFQRKLLKQIANAFWGSLVTGQMTKTLINSDNKAIANTEASTYPGKTGGETLSAWISAKVSDKVFREFIEPCEPIYFDTDGGFIHHTKMPPKSSSRVGDWVDQGLYTHLEIVGWQAYAAHSSFSRKPKIVLSGLESGEGITYRDFKVYAESKERIDKVAAYHPMPQADKLAAIHKTKPVILFNIPSIVGFGDDWLIVPPKVAPDAVLIAPKIARQISETAARITESEAASIRALVEVAAMHFSTSTDTYKEIPAPPT